MSVASAILSLNPSSYWKLDEASGNAADEVGGISGVPSSSGVDPPIQGQFPITPGDGTGKSALFGINGTNGHFNFGDVYDFTGTSRFTALAWLRPTSYNAASGHLLWSAHEGLTTHGWGLWLVNPAVTFSMRRGDAAGFDAVTHTVTQADFESGLVRMVAMRYDGTNLVLNINGVDVAQGLSSKSVVEPPTNTNLVFGEHNVGGSGVRCWADDLAIFSYALTENQLRTIYNGGTVVRSRAMHSRGTSW